MPKFMSFDDWKNQSDAIYDDFVKIPGCKDWDLDARGSLKNDIIRAVNSQVPKDQAGLKDDFQKAYYDYLWKSAELHKKAYGFWPVFDMYEMESDDPRLDIYSGK